MLMVCGLHLLLLLCPSEKTFKKIVLSIQGCQRYVSSGAVSDAFPYGCQQLPRVNEFYSQYPGFEGFAGIQNVISVPIWLREGIAILSIWELAFMVNASCKDQ